MTTEQPIRIGIIGAGANTTQKHIPQLQAQPNTQIIGVANRTPDSGRRVAGRFQIPKVYDHWHQAIEDPDTQAIVIGTWPYLHCEATLAALSAGKHVLTEARMAMNGEEARRMLEAAQARPDLVAQVVPSPITLDVDATIVRLRREGFLGDLLAIECRQAAGFLDRDAPLHWRQDIRYSGHNILAMGIWYEAIMRWAGEAKTVMAQGKIFTASRRDADGASHDIRVPEHLDVIADMHCGAQLHLQQSAVTAHLQGEGVMLYGTDGVLRFNDGLLTGARRGDAELTPISISDHDRGRWRVEEEFINAIRGREEITHTTFEDGLRYMRFTDAVHQSWTTHSPATV